MQPKMMRYLIINPFGIGDVLFTTPVVRAIKESAKDTFLGYWCNVRVEEILISNPHIDRIFALSRGDLKSLFATSWAKGMNALLDLGGSIKKEHFDIAIDFSLDHRYAVFCLLLGIRRRVGYDFKKRGCFLSERIPFSGYKDKHVVEYYLDLLKTLGIDSKGKHMELYTGQQSEIWADDFLESHNIKKSDLTIGVAPAGGLSWGKNAYLKYWPKENFAEVSDRLIEDVEAKVVFLGDENDTVWINEIVSLMRNKAVNASGCTSLGSLAALISKCNLLIANDGGPLHMATALGVKSVSLFGPTDEKVYGPYPESDKHIVISGRVTCRPCYNNFRIKECARENRCLREIEVDEVYSAALRLLDR